jgi:hypothetical protein
LRCGQQDEQIQNMKDGRKRVGIKNKLIAVEAVIELLNWIAQNDPKLANELVKHKFDCNAKIDNSHLQYTTITTADGPARYEISAVNLLNSLFGTIIGGTMDGYGPIAVYVDAAGNVLRFERTEVAYTDAMSRKHRA